MTPHMTTGRKATAQRTRRASVLHTPGDATTITGVIASQVCGTCAASLVFVDDPLELAAGVEMFRADRYVVVTPDGAAYATRGQIRDGRRCTP